MKYEANENPRKVLQTENGFEINYDFTPVQKEERTVIEFKKIIVPAIDYGQIVSAIIHSEYSIDDEIALRNNFIIEGDSQKWIDYIAFRNHAKEIAKEITGE